MVVARVVAFVVGVVGAGAILLSAIRTVVLPRAESAALSRLVFALIHRAFDLTAGRARGFEGQDRIMAFYAPVALTALPGAWILGQVAAFTLLFWALGIDTLRESVSLAGSSLTTMGFTTPPDLPTTLLAVIEALIGLSLIALLISYLPSIYSSFQRRELLVAMLEVRAGDPPSAFALIERHHRIGWLQDTDAFFARWEEWFADIEETHTSQPALAFFRSPQPGRSWITAAGAVLDAAALLSSTVDLPRMPQAEVCLRSGYLSLRAIADTFEIPYDHNPAPTDPITVARTEFDEGLERLRAVGVALRADPEQAWRDFAGWRVNYDQVLVTLAGLTMAPTAPWSSDRSVEHRMRPVARRRFLPRRRGKITP